MITDEDIFLEFDRIAHTLESLAPKRCAKISYHLLADAIYWSDEFPAGELSDFGENCMRLVLRYRTSLILGTPEPQWEIYWKEAQKRFPHWIGFSEDRISESNSLKVLIADFRSNAF